MARKSARTADGASPAANTHSRRRAAAGRPPFQNDSPVTTGSVRSALSVASTAESVSDAGSDLQYDPPLHAHLDLLAGFDQTVRLTMNRHPVGSARWRLGDGDAEGVVQLIDLTVSLPVRRHGHGRRLLAAVITQVKALHLAAGKKPRRIWAVVPQKTHVGGRAFLTACGFHHVATLTELYKDQDLLTYTLALD